MKAKAKKCKRVCALSYYEVDFAQRHQTRALPCLPVAEFSYLMPRPSAAFTMTDRCP